MLGYADDAIIVAAVLRSVVRRVGMAPLRRHWPGTPDGLAALARLTGLPAGAAELAATPGPHDTGPGSADDAARV